MRRTSPVGIGILVAAVLLGAGALGVGQTKVPPQAIASSVTRTPELVERAWRLPVAATFNRQLTWQSKDLVFILDVNPDFQPWLVERTRLFSAVNTLDSDKKRGLLLIE